MPMKIVRLSSLTLSHKAEHGNEVQKGGGGSVEGRGVVSANC